MAPPLPETESSRERPPPHPAGGTRPPQVHRGSSPANRGLPCDESHCRYRHPGQNAVFVSICVWILLESCHLNTLRPDFIPLPKMVSEGSRQAIGDCPLAGPCVRVMQGAGSPSSASSLGGLPRRHRGSGPGAPPIHSSSIADPAGVGGGPSRRAERPQGFLRVGARVLDSFRESPDDRSSESVPDRPPSAARGTPRPRPSPRKHVDGCTYGIPFLQRTPASRHRI